MKCVSCGAILEADQSICPYCGARNEEAIHRKERLDTLEKENRLLKKTVLWQEKETIAYKIHKRINLALVCIFLLSVVISLGVFLFTEGHLFGHRGTEEEMLRYYEEGDYESLYLCMSSGELFDPEKHYEYGHLALLWRSYQDCQTHFATAYESYVKTGLYDAYELERCIKDGCAVLTGNLSTTYSQLSDANRERLAPYQEQIRILFTGALQLPEEMLADLEEQDPFYREKPLKDYVLEVLPNE